MWPSIHAMRFPLQDGALCGHDGRLDEDHFKTAMRQQLRLYAGRRLADFLAHGRTGEAEQAQVHLA